MTKKEQNIEGVKALQSFHEIEAEKREQALLERFKGREHILKWFQSHSSRMGGKVGELFRKYRAGTLHRDALASVYERLHSGDEWENDDSKKLIDHLVKGEFQGFGKKFHEISKAMDDKDEDVRKLALDFVRQETIQGERGFFKKLSELKKSKLSPEDLTLQTKGALAVMEGGDETAKSETHEIIKKTDYGILPPPPESDTFPESVRQTTEYLEESTRLLDEIHDLVATSQTLAKSKKSLRARIDADPEFAKRLLEALVEDYELLKRSAELVSKKGGSAELLKAMGTFDNARRLDEAGKHPFILRKDETLHTRFLRAKESQPQREVLMKAAGNCIKHGLLETVLEVETERAVDEEVYSGESSMEESLRKIREKYDPKNIYQTQILEKETIAKIRVASKAFNDHENKHAEGLRKYNSQSTTLSQWQNLCVEVAGHIALIQKKAGIKLVDTEDGLPVFPRKVNLTYKDEGLKSLNQRYNEKPDEEPKEIASEFKKNGKGQVTYERRKAKITNIEYIPDVVGDDEPDVQRDMEENERWHPENPKKGVLKITVERETLEGERKEDVMSVQEFLGWVSTNNAYEDISDPKKVEEMVKETIETTVSIEPGAMFLAESVPVDGVPQYQVVEIAEIKDGVAILKVEDESRLPIFRSKKEQRYSSAIVGDTTAMRVPLGALYSWIVRRDMVQIGNEREESLDNLSDEERAYKFNYGSSGENETRFLKKGGTLGDVLARHGNAIFGGAALTASQLEAFKRTPTFEMEGRDVEGRRLVRRDIPGGRLMQMQEKYAMADLEKGEPAIRGGKTMPEEEKLEYQISQSTEPKEQKPEKQEIENKKKHYRKEALPKSALGMDGEAHRTHVPYLKDLWRRTTFLASDDIYGLFKACYEHYQRRWNRRSKEKFTKVGKGLPLGYGTEMNRISQAAENEEVNQNMEAMEDWGIWQIQDTLRKASNKDQLKACFQTLAKKGHLRWDDIDMWRKLNEFVPPGKMIPIPPNDNPNFLDRKTKKTGFDYIEGAIDCLWGEGSYQGWYSENNGSQRNKLKEYQEKGKQLEGDPKHTKDITGELKILLEKHKKGEYVDPHEYEGLIQFMIEAGKGNMEAKLYYILEGVCIPSPVTGKTLMSFDRIGSINGDYVNKLPWMDYLTRRDVPRPDGTVSSWTIMDFKKWCSEWDSAAPMGKENEPNQSVVSFIWENVVTDERTVIRNNKGLRNAQDMDHDDAHFIIPLADEELINNICQNSSGSRRYFTVEGYGNAYPGYNQYIKTLSGMGEKAKVLNSIRAFARFNSIVSRRLYKDKDSYARLGPSAWNRPSVVDDRHTGWHRKQLEELITKIAYAYSGAPKSDKLIEIVGLMHQDTDEEEKEKQKSIEMAIMNFGKVFEQVVSSDGGAKMLATVNSANLSGMSEHVSAEERIARKAMYKEGSELDSVFTDWHSEMN